MLTVHNLNRLSGLALRAMRKAERESYAGRMIRHSLSCLAKAKAALRRGNEAEALALVSWAHGSIRQARLAGRIATVA